MILNIFQHQLDFYLFLFFSYKKLDLPAQNNYDKNSWPHVKYNPLPVYLPKIYWLNEYYCIWRYNFSNQKLIAKSDASL